jgi:hypothetical protein
MKVKIIVGDQGKEYCSVEKNDNVDFHEGLIFTPVQHIHSTENTNTVKCSRG